VARDHLLTRVSVRLARPIDQLREVKSSFALSAGAL
jgi:hypothetical protein